VTASDVERFATRAMPDVDAARVAAAAAAPPVAVPAPVISSDGVAERIPFRGIRRKIAEALHHSISTAVHFTVVDEADVTTLDAKRREYAGVLGRKLSYLPFVLAAVCRALRAHPSLNANVDDANSEIIIQHGIHLGIAVDTDHGLMVPVLREADGLSLAQMGDQVADLAARCRDRTVPRELLTGGTFTISNVGSHGGMFATPIINYPEVGILGVGRVVERVLTRDGKFYAGKVMPLSMSCDHRVVDGAEGARFLNTVVRLLEAPESIVG
jgi:pyruvate dehydrogenase E2 component (dihydrolipoamide acetyltransferase)